MKKLFFGLVIGIFLTGAVPDYEADMGSRIARPKRAEIPQRNLKPTEQARVALSLFAECVFAVMPAKVVKAVDAIPGEDGPALDKLTKSDCLDFGEMSFSHTLFRGAMFAEMYRQHEALSTKAWRYPIKPLMMDTLPDSSSSEDVRANFCMLKLTECLYKQDAENLRGIVVNPVLSRAQNDAFAKVIPILGTCVPQGMTLTLNKTTLENGFAEYLYRSLATPTQSTMTDAR